MRPSVRPARRLPARLLPLGWVLIFLGVFQLFDNVLFTILFRQEFIGGHVDIMGPGFKSGFDNLSVERHQCGVHYEIVPAFFKYFR